MNIAFQKPLSQNSPDHLFQLYLRIVSQVILHPSYRMGRQSSFNDSDSDEDIDAGYHRLLRPNRWLRESSEVPGTPVAGRAQRKEVKDEPRNLVVCIDGTGNTFGRQVGPTRPSIPALLSVYDGFRLPTYSKYMVD